MKSLKMYFLALFFATFHSCFSVDFNYDQSSADKYVQSIIWEVIGISQNKQMSDSDKHKYFENFIEKQYDIKYATKFVLASNWKTLSVDEKKDFYAVYKDYLVDSYKRNVGMMNQTQPKLSVSPKVISNGKYEQVKIEIRYKNEKKEERQLKLEVVVFKDEGKYKINDIIIENLSILQSQRDAFAASIQSNGFATFLSQLKAKKEFVKDGKKQQSIKGVEAPSSAKSNAKKSK